METDNKKQSLGKWLVAILLATTTLVAALFGVTSCGSTTRAIVRNNSDGNSVTVTVSTNNPTNWQVNPDVEFQTKER